MSCKKIRERPITSALHFVIVTSIWMNVAKCENRVSVGIPYEEYSIGDVQFGKHVRRFGGTGCVPH